MNSLEKKMNCVLLSTFIRYYRYDICYILSYLSYTSICQKNEISSRIIRVTWQTCWPGQVVVGTRQVCWMLFGHGLSVQR